MVSVGEHHSLVAYLRLLLLWCGLILMPLGSAHAAETTEAAAPEFVIIVHPQVERVSLTPEELHAIVLGRLRYWRPDEPIQLVLELHGSDTRRVWVENIAAMASAQFAHFWIGSTFQRRAVSGPRAVTDSAAAVKLVEVLPGSIAIVRAERATPGVKVLHLDASDTDVLSDMIR
jgi:ABC-type phosphate transport system substrate-binding protein